MSRKYFKRFTIGETIRTKKYGILNITDVCPGCRLVWANNEKFNFLLFVTTSGRIKEEKWRKSKG